MSSIDLFAVTRDGDSYAESSRLVVAHVHGQTVLDHHTGWLGAEPVDFDRALSLFRLAYVLTFTSELLGDVELAVDLFRYGYLRRIAWRGLSYYGFSPTRKPCGST